MPWKRQTAFGRSSARSSKRSGSLGGATATAGLTSRWLQRPSSPSCTPNRSSQSPSSPIAIAPWVRSVPKLSRASSGQPIAFCTGAGARTSSPSASRASPTAPLDSSKSATKSRSSLIGLASCGFEVFAEQGFVQGLGALVVLFRLVQAATEDIECLVAARFGRAEPSIEHEIGEFAILLKAPQDFPHLPDHQPAHRDLLVEEAQNLLLQGVAGDKV